MLKNHEKLFIYIDAKEPPFGMLDKIMLRIAQKRRRRAGIRIACFGFLSLLAVAILIPTSQGLYSEMSRSGFMQFVSLLFSDASIVMIYWQDFALSLMEALPIFSVSAVLGSVLLLLFSLKFIVSDINALSGRSRLAARI